MGTKADFGAARREAEKSGALESGDRFKIAEGGNRIRVLSEFLPHTSYYKGQRRFQWLGYILDRKDSSVKTFFMPHTIHKAIEDFQQDPDWAFEEVPMPYDITINATGAGTKEVKYTVIGSPKRTPLTAEEEAKLLAKKDIAEVQKAIYDKQNERGDGADSTSDAPAFDPDEIPA